MLQLQHMEALLKNPTPIDSVQQVTKYCIFYKFIRMHEIDSLYCSSYATYHLLVILVNGYHFTAAAPASAQNNPNDKSAWPPALKQYVVRAFSTCTSDSDRAFMQST